MDCYIIAAVVTCWCKFLSMKLANKITNFFFFFE